MTIARRHVSLMVLLACLGCSGEGSGTTRGDASRPLRIAVIPKGTSHDFWLSIRYGAEQAARDLSKEGRKIEIEWSGTADETDKSGQKKIVETFIAQGVDGIVLAPIDRDTFGPVVEQASRRDVPVVLFDSALSDKYMPLAVSYVATDNHRGGVMAGEHLAKLVEEQKAETGRDGVILLRYQAGSESTEQREKGFLDTVGKPEHDLLVLSEDQRIDSDAAEALKVGESLVRDHRGKLAGVFTVCEPNNKGMLQALENEKLAGKVVFVAFDSDPRMVEGLRKGMVHGVVLQDPVHMGYEAVRTMVAHLDGKPVDERIDTGVYLATPENMDEPRMRELLAPEKYGVE